MTFDYVLPIYSEPDGSCDIVSFVRTHGPAESIADMRDMRLFFFHNACMNCNSLLSSMRYTR